ncbi:MAG: hypothetical protein GXP15_11415 [Gammaproteobacteria bacterium]|nr:hypothetical protein [Gammaproteobacteria bacterium]
MRNEPLSNVPRWQRILLWSVCVLPCLGYAAPGDILFSDNFERSNLAPWTTTNPGVSGIMTGGQTSNSPNRGAFTRSRPVAITSPAFNAAVPAAQVSVWVRRGSDAFSEYPDSGENLVIEYRRADNSWAALATFLGGGSPGQVFLPTLALPPDGLHGSLAIRARQTGGSNGNFDWWHIDDVVVTETAPPVPLTVGSCDNFESGLSGNWSINQFSGFAGTSAATSQSPVFSLFLNGGVVEVTSSAIDTSDLSFSDISMWIRRGADAFSEDPDNVENLVIEYLNDGGGWTALETFTGNGAQGQIFLRTFNIPAAGRHAGFRLRFRQTAGSGAGWDFWHIDDVCMNQVMRPDLLVTKSVQTVSDPVNGSSNPKAIPGAIMLYTINVSNQGPGPVDNNSLAITDIVPADSALFVGTSGGDPIVFADGAVASGLSYNFASDVTFSSQPGGGTPFTYSPTPDAQGYDAAVTGYRVNPAGSMNAAVGSAFPAFNILLTVRIQ